MNNVKWGQSNFSTVQRGGPVEGIGKVALTPFASLTPGPSPGGRGGHGPWYREPWPWLLMVAPLAAVVGGAVTLWLAVSTSDGLVAEDYYKQGLAINRTISRDVAARSRNLRARVVLGDGLNRVRVTLSGEGLPDRLTLHIVHPTRPGMDQTALLRNLGRGTYEAALQPLRGGRWQVTLEDEARSWRLAGAWRLPEQSVLELAAP